MTEQTQQEFLKLAKENLGCTWDQLAAMADINPRALKTYRMPSNSKDFRAMNILAKSAITRVLNDQKKKLKKSKTKY